MIGIVQNLSQERRFADKFEVIAVSRGFSGGHESCCPKNPVQRRGLRRVIVGGRAFEGGFGQQWSFPGDSLELRSASFNRRRNRPGRRLGRTHLAHRAQEGREEFLARGPGLYPSVTGVPRIAGVRVAMSRCDRRPASFDPTDLPGSPAPPAAR
jgi:hypothetical protein